jgi:3-oxoacid CoA-transferase subunit B
MKTRLDRETIALRAAKELQDGWVVNLGVGIPTLAPKYIPAERKVIFHTENGALGFGPPLSDQDSELKDHYLINAGAQFLTRLPGMSFFDHATSFGMIRGGHIDATILGGLQVSRKGDLANWTSPDRRVKVIGGSMDLARGAKRVIVTMLHTTEDGRPKILNECTYPLTCKECVNTIITDIACIEVTTNGLVLKEIAPGWTGEEVQSLTEAKLLIASDLKEIAL